MCARGVLDHLGISVAVYVGKINNGNAGGEYIKMGRKHRIRNTEHAGEEGKSKALVRKERYAALIFGYDLVPSVCYTLVAERLKELVASLLYTLDTCLIVLAGEGIGEKSGMLVPSVPESHELIGMEKLLYLG